MDMQTLQSFFMWCTIINFALLMFSFVMILAVRSWAFKIHSKMFKISEPAFNTSIFAFMGLYKMFVMIFNLIPWIALAILNAQ